MTGTLGGWFGADTYSYWWERCAADGAGCVSTGVYAGTYLVGSADRDKRLRFVVTGHGSSGDRTVPSEHSAVVVEPTEDDGWAPSEFSVPTGGSQTVQPNAFGGQTTTIYNADGSIHARSQTNVDGHVMDTVWYGAGGAPTTARSATYMVRGGPRGSLDTPRCTNLDTNPQSYKWARTATWEFRVGSTPSDLNRTATRESIAYAHRTVGAKRQQLRRGRSESHRLLLRRCEWHPEIQPDRSGAADRVQARSCRLELLP